MTIDQILTHLRNADTWQKPGDEPILEAKQALNAYILAEFTELINSIEKVTIHFKEDSIPSLRRGKLTDESKQEILAAAQRKYGAGNE